MLLHLQTWPDIDAYLTKSQAVIMPIGSTEQHGPNGLIGTDAICAEAVAKGVGEKLGLLVAPTIAVGMAQHHLAFSGSISLRPSTLIAVIRDNVLSLARHGFRDFYFINGHGGNIATITAAFSEIHAETSLGKPGNESGLRLKLRNWWEAPGVGPLSRELFPGAEGHHATPSEVSLTWAIHPEAARPMKMDPPIAPSGGFSDAEDYRRRFPDGRIGSNPGLASREAGERFYAAAVEGVAEDCRSWLSS
jgi:creatinine amidohydrolase